MNPSFYAPIGPLEFLDVRDVTACFPALFDRANAPPSAVVVVRGFRFSAAGHEASS